MNYLFIFSFSRYSDVPYSWFANINIEGQNNYNQDNIPALFNFIENENVSVVGPKVWLCIGITTLSRYV